MQNKIGIGGIPFSIYNFQETEDTTGFELMTCIGFLHVHAVNILDGRVYSDKAICGINNKECGWGKDMFGEKGVCPTCAMICREQGIMVIP